MTCAQANISANYHEIGNTLFATAAALVITRIDDYRTALPQQELALINDAIDKRAREFSTGRHCAHLAMQQLDIASAPLLKGSKREPIWPAGVVGSISHCRDLAGAVVAKKSSLQSVGFDVENRKQLDPRIARHVCTADESAWLDSQAPNMRQLSLLLIFSLKEAVFKCVYQASGVALRFRQCQLVPNFEAGTAKAELAIDIADMAPAHCQLRFCYNENHVFSGAALHGSIRSS